MFAVVGASGRTGRLVAETLLAQGERVRVIVRDATKGAGWAARGAEVGVASLADSAGLTDALAGVDGLYAVLPEDPSAADFHGHRLVMAEATARAVGDARVPHVVFLSALPAVLADGNGVARDLHQAELRLRAVAPGLTILRAVGFQENVASALGAARQGIYPSFLPSADLPVPMVSTVDVGRFAARCLVEPATEVVDVFGPSSTARQIAELLGLALGRTLTVVNVPPAGQVAALMQAGVPAAYAEAIVELYACFASGRVQPAGDRTFVGTTTLAETIAAVVR